MTDNTQTTGRTELPRTIADYLAAHRARDAETAITYFTSDAAVTDDGKTYHGTADIRTWLDRSAREYTYTIELTGAEKIDDEHYTAINHLEGDFPGGVIDWDTVMARESEPMENLKKYRKSGLEHFVKFVRELPVMCLQFRRMLGMVDLEGEQARVLQLNQQLAFLVTR